MALYMEGAYKAPVKKVEATTWQTPPTIQGKPAPLVAAQINQDVNRVNPVSVVNPDPIVQAIIAQAIQPQAQQAPAKTWEQTVQEAHDARVASYNTAPEAAPEAAPAAALAAQAPAIDQAQAAREAALQQAVQAAAAAFAMQQAALQTATDQAAAKRASANITIPNLAYNYNMPNMAWNPAADQLSQWNTLGLNQATGEAAPQEASINTGLTRFNEAAGQQKTEGDQQYTSQELAIANVVKNQVLNAAVENAIRRGAAGNSGWLNEQTQNAGKYETEQRQGIKTQANTFFNDIANQMMNKQTESNDALTELARLKGLRTNVLANQLQGTERTNVFNEKSADWANQLSQGSAVSQQRNADFANQMSKGSMINAEAGQEWQNVFNQQQFASAGEAQKWQNVYNQQQFGAQGSAQAAQEAFDQQKLAEQIRASQVGESYNQQALAAQIDAQQWQQGFSQEQADYGASQDALSNQLASYSTYKAPTGGKVSTPNYLIPGTTDWARYQELSGMGTKTLTASEKLQQQVQDSINQKILDSLSGGGTGTTTSAKTLKYTNNGMPYYG